MVILSGQKFEITAHVDYLNCSVEEKELISSLFQKHRYVFSKDDDDMIKNQILLDS